MMTLAECRTRTELDRIELGELIAYYWCATIRWPALTLDAAFRMADFWREQEQAGAAA